MEIVAYHLELAIASLQVFLTLLAILVCIEIIIKSSRRLRKAFIFFLIAFIPSIAYIIGRVVDIEARFTMGKSLSLSLSALTITFILLGLTMINKLLKEISKEGKKRN